MSYTFVYIFVSYTAARPIISLIYRPSLVIYKFTQYIINWVPYLKINLPNTFLYDSIRLVELIRIVLNSV